MRAPAAAVQGRKAARLLDEAKHHHQVGELDRAESIYRRVLGQEPENAEALHFLGVILWEKGEHERALDLVVKSIEINPTAAHYHRNLGTIVIQSGFTPSVFEARNDKVFEGCFASPGVDYQALSKTVAAHLKLKYRFQPHMEAPDGLETGFAEELSSDTLFRLFLERTVNVDAEMEEILTALRRAMLLSYSGARQVPESVAKLMSALAQQCFNNEFIFDVEDDEAERLAGLEEAIEGGVRSGGGVSEEMERDLLLLSMYVPLHALSGAGRLREAPVDAWPRPLQPIVRQTLLEPMEEAEIKGGIESIADIEDSTSRAVRSQYEENPYPRWVALPYTGMKTTLPGDLKRKFPHFSPPACLRGPVQALIAGCGTGLAPLSFASVYANVDILAVDLSKSSLAYATRMAREAGIKNVRFLQGDILDLAKLNQRFHVITCGGVLHHMEQPAKGWEVLLGLLEPGGLMKIGLYSELARRHIVKMRERIQEAGLEAKPADIRSLRKKLFMERDNPEVSALLKFRDVFNMSNCRDLLFHVKEHRFTLPEIERILEEKDLAFVGMELPNPKVKLLYKQNFPLDPDMTSLNSWHCFEEMFPDTFSGMYQFWCQKQAPR